MQVQEQIKQVEGWPQRIKDLASEVVEQKNWKWYLDQKPKWLAQKIDHKFDTKVTSAKLRGLKRRMVNEGILKDE